MTLTAMQQGRPGPVPGRHPLRAASLAALQRAASARHLGADAVAALLYSAGTLTVAGRVEAALTDRAVRDAVRAAALDVPESEDVFTPVDRGYWAGWSRIGRADGGRYKLYVSPLPGDLPLVLARVLSVAVRHDVDGLKVGHVPSAWLRPDKLLVYAKDEAVFADVATELAEVLRGVPAHGVPFTRPLDGSGLLSLGLDPLPRPDAVPVSWRSWVTRALAEAICSGPATAAVPRALAWLRLAGVDPLSGAVDVEMFEIASAPDPLAAPVAVVA